ncbi:OLC1v1025594C1 [Oldenlandia corymbosa var. corymbosa]|uniref:OLC1v1025594C1 n=1 Tax=Oldenlandia corymbosa var. corymbosa TaxID=529605 RepID=A0AAV1C5A8_OLDCO|nr:OLC1v1025594C1 [Oldenlandia corymbosa var. corymbosa]
MIVSDVALEAFLTDYFRTQAERNNNQIYWNKLCEMFQETMRADGHKNKRCTRLTAAFLNRTRSYYALIEEERVNDGFKITMDGDQGFHAMDIDPPPSEDDEDHNGDQTDEEENHEDPDENRFGNGVINDGGPQENGFHEGSATSSPPGSVARGNSPNSVLSFPSFTVSHDDRDRLPNYNLLELTQATFSPLSNLIPSEDQPQETNGLENSVDVVSYVEPSVLVNSQISGNSNVLSVEEHSVDVPSPGIGDLNIKDKDRKFSVDQDTLFDTENEMVAKEVDAENLVTPEMEEADAQYQLEEQAAQYFSRLLVAGDEINSMEKAIILSWPQLREKVEKEASTKQKRGRQMLMYQKELRTNGTLATDQSLTVLTYQPHRTLERLKRWKRQMALENMTVRSDLLVGNEAKDTDTMAKRPREVTEAEQQQLGRKA